MARTAAADIVGNLFFNVADIPCFVFSVEEVSGAAWLAGPQCDRYCAGLHQPELVGTLHAAGGEAVRSLAPAASLLQLISNIPAESDAIRPRSTIHGRRAEPEEVGVKSTNSSIYKLICYAVK